MWSAAKDVQDGLGNVWTLLERTTTSVEKFADGSIPLRTVTGRDASLDSLVVPGEELLAQCPTRMSQCPQDELPLNIRLPYRRRSVRLEG